MSKNKTIVDVRVKDIEKWRYPSKHYVGSRSNVAFRRVTRVTHRLYLSSGVRSRGDMVGRNEDYYLQTI